jgi:hypothetical protein
MIFSGSFSGRLKLRTVRNFCQNMSEEASEEGQHTSASLHLHACSCHNFQSVLCSLSPGPHTNSVFHQGHLDLNSVANWLIVWLHK